VAQLFGVPFAIVSGGLGCIAAVGLIVRKWPALLHYNGDEPLAAGDSIVAGAAIPPAS
jgi:hypothetical protein